MCKLVLHLSYYDLRSVTILLYSQYCLIQTLCGGTGVTDVTDVTDIMDVTDILDGTNITDIVDITDVT